MRAIGACYFHWYSKFSLLILTFRASSTRGDRVVWLFEELNVPYELKIYKNHFTNKEMKKLPFPSKVPCVEIKYKDGTDFWLSETSYIFSYFLRNYNPDNKLIPANELERELAEYYVNYSEGTLSPLVIALFLSKNVKTPDSIADKVYNRPNFTKNMKFLEETLAKQHAKHSKYLVGSELSHADLIMSTGLFLSFEFGLIDKSDYPEVYQYYTDLLNEPVYKQARSLNKLNMGKL